MTTAPDRLPAIVAFLQDAAGLKDTLRSGHTTAGRRESVADHTWRLCLLALLLERDMDANLLQVLKLCLVHDLGEAMSGDVPAPEQHSDDGRAARERADFATLASSLPEDLRAGLMALHDEYEAGETAEARMAKGLDKIETVLQHVAGRNPEDFDYAFNLDYARNRTDTTRLLRALRALADEATRERMR